MGVGGEAGGDSGTRSSGRRRSEGEPVSRFVGVSWSKGRGQWRGMIMLGGVPTFLGHFDAEDEAALVYDMEAAAYGESSSLANIDALPIDRSAGCSFSCTRTLVSIFLSLFASLSHTHVVPRIQLFCLYHASYLSLCTLLGKPVNFPDTGQAQAVKGKDDAKADGAAAAKPAAKKRPFKKDTPEQVAVKAAKAAREAGRREEERQKRKRHADTVKAERASLKKVAAAAATAAARAALAAKPKQPSKPPGLQSPAPKAARRSSASSSAPASSASGSFGSTPLPACGDDGRRSSRLSSRHG
jgi:pyruvate/2-oxoglutarate dehydrogenase complex dihydrolipoamide acyltransferase (E2) component